MEIGEYTPPLLLSNPVRICNCTELGYCYMAPASRGHMGPVATASILGGVVLFCGKRAALVR